LLKQGYLSKVKPDNSLISFNNEIPSWNRRIIINKTMAKTEKGHGNGVKE